MDEMRGKGLTPTKNTYLAALNALAETARVDDAWALLSEMQEHGIPPDEFAFTALINGYKRAKPVRAAWRMLLGQCCLGFQGRANTRERIRIHTGRWLACLVSLQCGQCQQADVPDLACLQSPSTQSTVEPRIPPLHCQAPLDVEARIDDLLKRCREVESMDFSRRRRGGLGIVAYNSALNTFCELGCAPSLCRQELSAPADKDVRPARRMSEKLEWLCPARLAATAVTTGASIQSSVAPAGSTSG